MLAAALSFVKPLKLNNMLEVIVPICIGVLIYYFKDILELLSKLIDKIGKKD
jgi:hypothetical protein